MTCGATRFRSGDQSEFRLIRVRLIAQFEMRLTSVRGSIEGSSLGVSRAAVLGIASTLVIVSCPVDQPTAESICFDAVGKLQTSFDAYEEPLDRGLERTTRR